MGDYTDATLLVPGKSYEWHWTMGEIVTAFCDVGMRIEFLHEHPQYFYNGYSSYCEDEECYLYPATFSLKATADLLNQLASTSATSSEVFLFSRAYFNISRTVASELANRSSIQA